MVKAFCCSSLTPTLIRPACSLTLTAHRALRTSDEHRKAQHDLSTLSLGIPVVRSDSCWTEASCSMPSRRRSVSAPAPARDPANTSSHHTIDAWVSKLYSFCFREPQRGGSRAVSAAKRPLDQVQYPCRGPQEMQAHAACWKDKFGCCVEELSEGTTWARIGPLSCCVDCV